MSNGANNVANQFGDLVVTPRTQPTNQSQPTTPKKERPQSQNTKMRQTNAQRPLNFNQGASTSGGTNNSRDIVARFIKNYSNKGKDKGSFGKQDSFNAIKYAELTNEDIENIAKRSSLNKRGASDIQKKTINKLLRGFKIVISLKKKANQARSVNEKTKKKAEAVRAAEDEREAKGIRPASDYRSLVVGGKIYTEVGKGGRKGSKKGRESKEKDILALTMGRYASKIKYFKFKRGATFNINEKNYKSFVTCFDAGAEGGSLKDILKRSRAPYLTSVATMYDPGHQFRKDWHLNHYIKNAFYYFSKHENQVKNLKIQNYPDHFIDFSPIHINFLYKGNIIYTKIEFLGVYANINNKNNKNNENNENNGKKKNIENKNDIADMTTKLTVSSSKIPTNNLVNPNPIEILKKYILNFLLAKKDKNKKDRFWDFISKRIKVLSYKPVVKTINLDNEGMRLSIISDIRHDYNFKKYNGSIRKKNNMTENKFYDEMINYFKLNEEFGKKINYTYTYEGKSTKTNPINRTFISSNKNKITNPETAPFVIKLLGDLSQIVYCMERNVFFATFDASALNMAIRLSRVTNEIKKFKAFYEEETKNKVGMLYINYPASYKTKPRFRIPTVLGNLELENPELEVDKLTEQQRYFLSFEQRRKFIEPTLTFADVKGELLQKLRLAIKKKLASNLPPSTNALRKFVTNEFINAKNRGIILSNNDKKNILDRLVYDYASVRRNNLN